eukprot:4898048-Karenia_brevis.AAC.1
MKQCDILNKEPPPEISKSGCKRCSAKHKYVVPHPAPLPPESPAANDSSILVQPAELQGLDEKA